MQQMQVGAQLAQTQANIESAQKMAKWQNDLNREISLASLSNQKDIANIQAAASMYGADQSSSASAYAAQMAFAASKYGADKSFVSNKYRVDNPDNALMYGLKHFFEGDLFDIAFSSLKKSFDSIVNGVSSLTAKKISNKKKHK